MTFWKTQNYGDTIKISGCQGLGWGINRRNTEDFQDNENTLYDTVMMETCHYMLPKPIECTPPSVNSNVSYGLPVIIRYQYWLISSFQCTILVRILRLGKVMQLWSRQHIGNLCNLLLSLAVNFKLL